MICAGRGALGSWSLTLPVVPTDAGLAGPAECQQHLSRCSTHDHGHDRPNPTCTAPVHQNPWAARNSSFAKSPPCPQRSWAETSGTAFVERSGAKGESGYPRLLGVLVITSSTYQARQSSGPTTAATRKLTWPHDTRKEGRDPDPKRVSVA